jgi:hypothetical protein
MSGRPLQHRPGREKECLSLSLEPSCQKRIVVLRVALALYRRQRTSPSPAKDKNHVRGTDLKRRAHPDLNQGPADLQSAALTTELCTHVDGCAATDSSKA